MNLPNINQLKSKFTCEFCKKDFLRESTLVTHSCERKRRWHLKDNKDAIVSFYVYQKFFEISNRSKIKKTYEQFISSRYFSLFLGFGKYLLEVNPPDQEEFVTYILRNNINVKDWTTQKVYDNWVREFGRKESPYRAMERNIILMQKWGHDTNNDWNNFFREVNPQLATQWICNGRISPWLLYLDSGDALLSRLSSEQFDLINDIVDPTFWVQRIKNNLEEIKNISSLLKEYKI